MQYPPELTISVDVSAHVVMVDMLLINKYLTVEDMCAFALSFFADDVGQYTEIARLFDISECIADQISGHPDFMPTYTVIDDESVRLHQSIADYEKIMGVAGTLAHKCEDFYRLVKPALVNAIPYDLPATHTLDKVKYVTGRILTSWVDITRLNNRVF